jgi:hypothetical protein
MLKRAFIIKEKKERLGPIANAAKSTGIEIFDFSEINLVKDYDSLIVFYNKTFPKINTKAKVGWWMCDLNPPEKLIKQDNCGCGCDYIFLCNLEYNKLYEEYFKKPVFYMPQCGLIPEATEGRKIDWEVLFIGNNSTRWHSNRKILLDGIAENFKLKIISGERTTEDQSFLYRNSKFNLSISLPMHSVTSNRLYNILSSGGFALVSWFPGIEDLFENHKHLVWFKKLKEAKKMIEFYSRTSKQKSYERVRTQGRILYQKKHTAGERLVNMFDILEGRETKFRGFLEK